MPPKENKESILPSEKGVFVYGLRRKPNETFSRLYNRSGDLINSLKRQFMWRKSEPTDYAQHFEIVVYRLVEEKVVPVLEILSEKYEKKP